MKSRLAAPVTLMLLGCGGRISDDSLGVLVEENRLAVCKKDVACGLADANDPCPPARPLQCTRDPAEIRQCLDELPARDCQDYELSQSHSCVTASKSPDGC
jgi:hypothetical protein